MSKNRISIMILHLLLLISLLPNFAYAKCKCGEPQTADHEIRHPAAAFELKIIAMASILVASSLGVCIPLFLKNVRAFHPETGLHFLIKAFAAGVILATGFIHVLPDAFDSFNGSPGGFSFTGFIAMMAAIVTLTMEALVSGYHRRVELMKAQPVDGDEENTLNVEQQSPPILLERSSSPSRNRITSQVLELGIVVHSMVIGVTMGVTQRPTIIKPLIAALSFHQFFEGIGLGGCISQANFKAKGIMIMVLFFSLTTPSGIGIGMMVARNYNEQSPSTLLVQGILNSISAGILIYMALVDLLAADFMNPKLQTNFRLQLGANFALLLGASCMSLMAKLGNS